MEISKLNTEFKIRKISQQGLESIKEKIEKNGFLDSFPIIIDENNLVIDGHHRVEAALALGLTEVPTILKSGLTEAEKKHLAFIANEASETSVPMTMVDYCEFIWGSEDKLADIALQIGWSEAKVKDHSALKVLKFDKDKEEKVDLNSWNIIVDFFHRSTEEVDKSTFNRKLLSGLIKLNDAQQCELITDLADDRINKNKFKALAEKYAKQNADIETLKEQLENKVPTDLLDSAILEIENGNYNLENLIQLTLDKHDKKTSIKLIHGDFYEEVKNIKEGSINLIVTDPPYNIAHENDDVYEGRKNVSSDFGEWDKVEHTDFKQMIKVWATEFKRILAPNGSGYLFTSDVYLSHIREYIEEVGLRYRATIIWHKTNPGTSATKGNFISSNEYIIYFDNGEKPTLNWMGENEMQNFFQSPICGGNERIKDKKGNTLHPTQKPKSVIRHLIDISSNKGDLIFDGFMGSGTTAHVAKDTDRKFVGIEFDKAYFDAAKERTL